MTYEDRHGPLGVFEGMDEYSPELVVGQKYQVDPADEHHPHRVGVYKETVNKLARMIDPELSEKHGEEVIFMVRSNRLMKI